MACRVDSGDVACRVDGGDGGDVAGRVDSAVIAVVVVGTWQGWGESTSPPRFGPMGIDRGARRRRWRPRVMVVVGVVDGGGGERKEGLVTVCDTGDVSTTVARFGNTRAPINN